MRPAASAAVSPCACQRAKGVSASIPTADTRTPPAPGALTAQAAQGGFHMNVGECFFRSGKNPGGIYDFAVASKVWPPEIWIMGFRVGQIGAQRIKTHPRQPVSPAC